MLEKMLMDKVNIAIVGHGYVGKAVEYGFNTSSVNQYIIDPIYNKGMETIKDVKIDVAFVCVPTPFGSDGKIDSSIVEEVVGELKSKNCVIAIKSTVTPDIVTKLHEENNKVVYNPEFLTEQNALEDFVNPPMHVFGGEKEYCHYLWMLYIDHSRCKDTTTRSYYLTPAEASFVKYGINSFLASKVLWFNQFADLCDKYNVKYNAVTSAMMTDKRIGSSHMTVPGPDGRKGYGGACFPKDTNAFSKFANGDFTLLDLVIEENNKYRSEYMLDDREKEQNVVYMRSKI